MRRFAAADSNKDGYLNSDEFCMYLHPGSWLESTKISKILYRVATNTRKILATSKNLTFLLVHPVVYVTKN